MVELVDLVHVRRAQGRPGAERRLAAIASRQHGIVARSQLTALGFGRGAIQRLAVGRLHRVHRGVYAVGHFAVTGRARWLAAVLACGPGALLSHRDGGALWELYRGVAGPVDVTYAGRTRHGRPGLRLHHVRHLHPDDRTARNGIPVTSVARTLLDLAQLLGPRQVRHAFDQADRIRLLDVTAVERVCDRCRGHPGRRRVLDLLQAEHSDLADTRSPLERRFFEFCVDAGLPLPAVNVVVAGVEVDAVWLDERLIVELDGYAFHRTRAAFEGDRVRDEALQLAGYRVLRVTHRRLELEPSTLVETIRRLLGAA